MTADAQLDATIAAMTAWRGREIGVTPITSGITNRNFLVEVGDEAFVVRIAGRDTELLGIDRAAEHAASRAAAVAGVGPPVVVYLPEHGALVTRFVPGRPVSGEELAREDVLASLVGSVRAFHACPAIPSTFLVFRLVETYARLAADRGVEVPDAYRDARPAAERIEAALGEAPLPAVPCHNDLRGANVLLDGTHTWIVDYEYAGMGDPFFDLGNLSMNNELTDEMQETLLRLYFGAPHDGHRARLALMRIVSDLREAMWGVVQQAVSTGDVDYVEHAARHFARLLEGARDDRFDGWLADATGPI